MRLAEVAGDDFYRFPEEPTISMYLDSNGVCHGSRPEPNDIVKQRIDIHSDGGARVTWFAFGDGENYPLSHEKRLDINRVSAGAILSEVRKWATAENLAISYRMSVIGR